MTMWTFPLLRRWRVQFPTPLQSWGHQFQCQKSTYLRERRCQKDSSNTKNNNWSDSSSNNSSSNRNNKRKRTTAFTSESCRT